MERQDAECLGLACHTDTLKFWDVHWSRAGMIVLPRHAPGGVRSVTATSVKPGLIRLKRRVLRTAWLAPENVHQHGRKYPQASPLVTSKLSTLSRTSPTRATEVWETCTVCDSSDAGVDP